METSTCLLRASTLKWWRPWTFTLACPSSTWAAAPATWAPWWASYWVRIASKVLQICSYITAVVVFFQWRRLSCLLFCCMTYAPYTILSSVINDSKAQSTQMWLKLNLLISMCQLFQDRLEWIMASSCTLMSLIMPTRNWSHSSKPVTALTGVCLLLLRDIFHTRWYIYIHCIYAYTCCSGASLQVRVLWAVVCCWQLPGDSSWEPPVRPGLLRRRRAEGARGLHEEPAEGGGHPRHAPGRKGRWRFCSMKETLAHFTLLQFQWRPGFAFSCNVCIVQQWQMRTVSVIQDQKTKIHFHVADI